MMTGPPQGNVSIYLGGHSKRRIFSQFMDMSMGKIMFSNKENDGFYKENMEERCFAQLEGVQYPIFQQTYL